MAACRRWAVWVSRVLYVDHNARAVTKQVARSRVHFTRASPTQAQLGWGFCFSSLPNPTLHVQDPALMLTSCSPSTATDARGSRTILCYGFRARGFMATSTT